MRLYGLKRNWADVEDYCWSGTQSRKVAQRRTENKKMLHRKARRTYKLPKD